jgi:hypothetical protein
MENRNQLLCLYCATCATLVCLKCTNKTFLGGHYDHQYFSEDDISGKNEQLYAKTKLSINTNLKQMTMMMTEKKDKIEQLQRDIQRLNELTGTLNAELSDSREMHTISKTSFDLKIKYLNISERKYFLNERTLSSEKIIEMTQYKKDFFSRVLYGEALKCKRDPKGDQILKEILADRESFLSGNGCNGVSPVIILTIACFALGEYQSAMKYAQESLKPEVKDYKDPFLQYMIGTMFYYGMGTTQNPEYAFKMFKYSANQGFAPGQTMYGRFYETGLYIKQDLYEACNYYQLAVSQDHSLASIRLGNLYKENKIQGKTIEDAKILFEKAIEIGNEEAKELYRDPIKK